VWLLCVTADGGEAVEPELKANILLVDDHAQNLLTLEAILSGLGQHLVKAQSGQEALKYLLDTDFAVILLDVHMPELDGLETARLIRQREKLRYTPIIFLTAIDKSDERVFQGYAVGAVDYLFKPFVPEVLRAKVAVFVELFKTAELRRQALEQLAVANQALQEEIAARQQAEEALRKSEELYRTLAANFPNGAVFLFNRELRYTIADGTGLTPVGLSKEALEGKTIWEALPPDTWAILEPHYRASLAGRAVSFEIPYANRLYLVHTLPIKNEHGEVFAGIAMMQDITAQKEAERLKDEVVSTISHELRTPLTSLRGFAELMLEREFPAEKQHQFLLIMHDETVRLTNLINDFLDLQRIQSGRQSYHFDRLELIDVLRESIALFTQAGEKHPLRLEAPDALPPVQVDKDRIRQVLSNLLSNAVKFSPRGGEVTVGARQEGAEVVVWVADQGVGIPPEALPKLFSIFFRADNAETRNIGGTGLGLALVKGMVEAHQGRVWVESEIGRGSTFFFTLPVAGPALPTMAVPEVVSGSATDILLVENDLVFAQLLCERFEGAGLAVTTIGYAEQALERARLTPPRLLLVDIHLAGEMDGWDLLVALKSDPVLQAIPIIIITESEEPKLRGLALAGADYLPRPVSTPGLMQAIRRQLPSLSGKRVLVADDDDAFRRQVVELLAVEPDIQVVEAGNGRDVLRHVAQRLPDLLMLDLLMPEMDGFEVLRQLRADKRAINLPVLVVTGKDLLPAEKAHIKRKMAFLVSKKEASLDHFARVVGRVLGG
jgi:PAS domain S-box-containing protein